MDSLMLDKDELDEWKIPLYKIYSDDEDVNLITKVVRRGTRWAIGPEIDEFEKIIANYVGCDYCVALNSGTSALHATLLAYGLHDNEVIVPSFTFISTANSVLFVNAKPIFADIEQTTYGLDPIDVNRKITSSTKAIMPVDYGGLSCQISEIKQLAIEHNLVIIEDAAEALGSSIKGRKVGSISDSAIFSFCANKVITTGEGGATVTNSKEIYEKIKLIRSHGRFDKTNYFNNPLDADYVDLGYNWRMSSISAALGISQMNKLDKIIKMRQENANYISSRISKHRQIQAPNPPAGYEHIYQLYTIRLSDKKTRDELHQHLLKKRIFSKVYFSPIHLTSFYMKRYGTRRGMLPVTEKVADEVLSLPLYPNMTLEEKEYLISSISEFFELN
jgi:perosamine synthetase